MQKKEAGELIRYLSDGMDVVELSHDHYCEFFITIGVPESKNAWTIQRKLLSFLQGHDNAQIVKADLFSPAAEWIKAFRSLNPDVPLTCIATELCRSGIAAGIYLHAVSGVEVRPIVLNGHLLGSIYEDDWMKCLFLADVRPESEKKTRIKQADQTFLKIAKTLQSEGLSFTDVVRTWLYIDEILSWYPDFNKVRAEFFKTQRVFDGLVPASTGISGRNHSGSALVAGVFALLAKNPLLNIQIIPSPLQCPAIKYGSSFSRAIEISASGYRQLLISGTASIDIDGQSMHLGDVRSQIDQTMKVVQAILHSRQMNWKNINRAIAYFKHAADCEFFD
ncbi:MAG: hypothetical protein WC865_03005, partial [Bacteroidales bacterium]